MQQVPQTLVMLCFDGSLSLNKVVRKVLRIEEGGLRFQVINVVTEQEHAGSATIDRKFRQ